MAPYQKIIEELRQRISDGRLRPGDRIPSARAITREWGVAIATATKVLAALQQEGLTRAVPGVGTVVAEQRQAPRELSKESIVEAAIGIADAEGLGAVSMRRVATAMGVATMSLYRHVPAKEDLLLLMMDRVLSEEQFAEEQPEGWRERLEVAARLLWTVFRRHRWVAGAMTTSRPQFLPNALHYAEWVLGALHETGLDETAKLYVHVSMFTFVRGAAMAVAEEAEAQQETGMDADRWMEMQRHVIDILPEGGALARMAERDDVEFDLEDLFEFGLQRFLDGVQAWLGAPR